MQQRWKDKCKKKHIYAHTQKTTYANKMYARQASINRQRRQMTDWLTSIKLDKAVGMVRILLGLVHYSSTCLTCLLWNLSASAQKKFRAVLHTERMVCHWGCNSGSCQRFWSRQPQTLSVYGNVASASGFPLWKNLQGVEICEYG